jgi:hypothetical protein
MHDGMSQRPSTICLFYFPLVPIKGRGEQLSQGLDFLQIERHPKGLGSDTLSRTVCNPYYKHP